MIGVEAPVCRFGKCELPELHCDDSNLLCDALPPPCDEGTLPQVDEEEICYTGKCVPAESCDVVPSCDVCQKLEGYMCVTLVTQLGFVHSCDPIPPACMGAVSCECAGEACEEPYDLCGEGGDAELSCSCPEC
ncbi:MAG: hypothetical protein KC636_17125 [Myxococcales bacterium]|nr:hypothetical protein [Myxococcales bacterium]